MEKSKWKRVSHPYDIEYFSIHGKECEITIEGGKYIVKAHLALATDLLQDLDDQDVCPRYYFDIERAKLEVEAWLKKRKQWIE